MQVFSLMSVREVFSLVSVQEVFSSVSVQEMFSSVSVREVYFFFILFFVLEIFSDNYCEHVMIAISASIVFEIISWLS